MLLIPALATLIYAAFVRFTRMRNFHNPVHLLLSIFLDTVFIARALSGLLPTFFSFKFQYHNLRKLLLMSAYTKSLVWFENALPVSFS
jgi:hypothetical protein